MRISDWSSDVRSSDLAGDRRVQVDEEDGKPSKSLFSPKNRYRDATFCEVQIFTGRTHQIRVHALALGHPEIGSASCRERVCQYVSISVVADPLKTTNNASKPHTTMYTEKHDNKR